MKRFCLFTVLFVFVAAPSFHAQDTPAAIAEKQESEERFKTVAAKIENLEETILSHQKRMNGLGEELRALREAITRLNNNAAAAGTQKSLESLAEAIKEVDRKRIADNEKILTALADFRRGLSEKPTSPVRTNPPGRSSTPTPTVPPGAPERGYEYTIQANDHPTTISAKLAKQGFKITARQITDANPGVNWSKLKIGQKIFIPAPAQP